MKGMPMDVKSHASINVGSVHMMANEINNSSASHEEDQHHSHKKQESGRWGLGICFDRHSGISRSVAPIEPAAQTFRKYLPGLRSFGSVSSASKAPSTTSDFARTTTLSFAFA